MNPPVRWRAVGAAPARAGAVRGARRRRLRVAGVAGLAGLLVWALIGVPVFVLPATGPLPPHADVVLVLGDDAPQRIALAERLQHDGTAGEMLFSTPDRPLPSPPQVLGDCRREAHLICFVPDPSTTQGEARQLAAQARAHGWTSAIVVTQAAHVDRARTIIERCFPGTVTMAVSGEPPEGGWAHQYLYQTLATVKMWLHPGC